MLSTHYVWMTHQRLRLIRFIDRLLCLGIRKEQIFGMKVKFFDYRTFTKLFSQAFITKEYYFQARTDKPFIIDCGSNIGMSVLLFKLMYPKCDILAFEPDYDTCTMLESNIVDNNLKSVSMINKALANEDGTINFYSDPSTPGSMTMSVYNNMPQQCVKENIVETVTLSKYIHKEVDFLKMDIEGSEHMVIEDLVRENKLHLINEMVIEYHHHKDLHHDTLATMLSALETCGFGYQIRARLKVPFQKETYQDLIIYAYNKRRTG